MKYVEESGGKTSEERRAEVDETERLARKHLKKWAEMDWKLGPDSTAERHVRKHLKNLARRGRKEGGGGDLDEGSLDVVAQ